MSDDTDELQLGPVDFLVVEFPGSRMTGEGLPLLVDLVERGIVRVLDLVFVKKRDDGSVVSLDIGQLEQDGAKGLAVFQGVTSGLLGPDDIEGVADLIDAGSAAAVLVYENTWAAPLATALMRGGARMVASSRIPAPVLLEALDALDAAAPPEHQSAGPRRWPPAPRRAGRVDPMPGLIRGVARTAVIAGTATSVSNRVSRRQAGRWAAKDQQQYEHEAYEQQQAQQEAPPPAVRGPAAAAVRRAAPVAPPAASSMDDKLAQLQQLGQLKDAGVLTGAEFEQQKARILAS